jgi:hypothetical protein
VTWYIYKFVCNGLGGLEDRWIKNISKQKKGKQKYVVESCEAIEKRMSEGKLDLAYSTYYMEHE